MPMTKEQILTEAMTLNSQERDEVAEALWQSAEPGKLDSAQIGELRRRADDVDSGRVQAVPGEQVMQELRRRFKQ